MYHVIQSHSTIKSRYGSLWDWKYFHVVGNHVIENHVKQGMTVTQKHPEIGFFKDKGLVRSIWVYGHV